MCIRDRTRAHAIPLVLLTQQTTWASTEDPGVEEWQWLLHRGSTAHAATSMHAAMEHFNDVTRRLAQEYDLPLFDAARQVPKTREYFLDDVHYNVRGAHQVATWVAQQITQEALISTHLERSLAQPS